MAAAAADRRAWVFPFENSALRVTAGARKNPASVVSRR
jgi:hypothetical protein